MILKKVAICNLIHRGVVALAFFRISADNFITSRVSARVHLGPGGDPAAEVARRHSACETSSIRDRVRLLTHSSRPHRVPQPPHAGYISVPCW